MEQDLSKRVVKVTIELANGTVETRSIGDNDSSVIILVLEESHQYRNSIYCGSRVTAPILLGAMTKHVIGLAAALRMDKWQRIHQN